MFKLAIVYILVTSNFAFGDAAEWSYPENDWQGACDPEANKEQSPIDIKSDDLTPIGHYKPFIFHGYNFLPKSASVQNNGHSVVMTLKERAKAKFPTVTRGGLPGTYKFAQLHFHWGASSDKGSEHKINGKHYPMEVHLVHFNTKYGTDLGKAIAEGNNRGKRDSLAVLGTMFEIQEKDNDDFKYLMGAVKKAKTASREGKKLDRTFQLEKFLPRNTDRFFRYNGSLTTPACNEIVVWTVFKDSIGVSEAQMKDFRDLLTGDESSKKMVDNFRDVQPLNNRNVYDVDTSTKLFSAETRTSKASSASPVNYVLAIIMSLMTYYFCQV